MHMKPAEFHDDEIRGSGHGELDSHVGFKAQDVGTFHRALQIDDDEWIVPLEIHQARHDPISTKTFRDRNRNVAAFDDIRRGLAPQHIERCILHFSRAVKQSTPFTGEDHPFGKTFENRGTQSLLKPIDPAQHRR